MGSILCSFVKNGSGTLKKNIYKVIQREGNVFFVLRGIERVINFFHRSLSHTTMGTSAQDLKPSFFSTVRLHESFTLPSFSCLREHKRWRSVGSHLSSFVPNGQSIASTVPVFRWSADNVCLISFVRVLRYSPSSANIS